jgi:regulator of protease activity HflC (stomatin/prohibitin superfamily)
MLEGLILPIVILFLVVITLWSGVKQVPQGHKWTLERFGRFRGTLEPGLNIIVPFIDRVGRKVNMMEQVLDIDRQEIITKDNAMVAVDGVVFYTVMDAAKASYEVANLRSAVVNLTMTNIRTVMGSMDLDELLSQRDQINARLLAVVDHATDPWGIKVTRIEIKDIEPPKDLVNAMARQMKAERDKRAQILDAQGDREAEILRAEGLKQAAILEAEGRKEAAFRDAEARERSAQAEAEATRMVSEAIGSGSVQAVNYFVAQRYTAALEKMASATNAKVVYMPLEASSVIGAVGGIASLAKEAMSDMGGSNSGGGETSGGGAAGPWGNKS